MDNLSTGDRRRAMTAVRSTGSAPEMIVRRGLHARGFRYKLHDRTLPGRPDLVLPKWRAVVFVQGCFWHGHGCPAFRMTASRIDYWGPKILRNAHRDRRVAARLRRMGWRVLHVWECKLFASPEQELDRLGSTLRRTRA
jgi:DNA mismatch endonuclease, patch repair protein